ncbi:MAG: hypothetical protein P8H62_03095 [Henriciella sp.]|nr:hypothetical protein [Henriciella sp.]
MSDWHLKGINLFDAPNERYFHTNDNLGEVSYYGPRVTYGVNAKLSRDRPAISHNHCLNW